MKYRFTALVLVLALLLALCGCSEAVGEIAGNVADAAVRAAGGFCDRYR